MDARRIRKKKITHRQCAQDALALSDHLGVKRGKAIGISMGGNILPHMATIEPEGIEAMVVVSATMYFPEQARAIMRQVPVENQSAVEWETIRKRHRLGDEQIVALWEWQRGMKDSYDDMNFTSPRIAASTSSTATATFSIQLRWQWKCIAPYSVRRSGSCPMAATDLSSSTPSLSLFKPRLPFSEDRNKSTCWRGSVLFAAHPDPLVNREVECFHPPLWRNKDSRRPPTRIRPDQRNILNNRPGRLAGRV